MCISILKQFGRGAFSGSCRRDKALFPENVMYAHPLSEGIIYDILAEQPFLKILRHFLPLSFEPRNFSFMPQETMLKLLFGEGKSLLHPPHFSLKELALTYKRGFFFSRDP